MSFKTLVHRLESQPFHDRWRAYAYPHFIDERSVDLRREGQLSFRELSQRGLWYRALPPYSRSRTLKTRRIRRHGPKVSKDPDQALCQSCASATGTPRLEAELQCKLDDSWCHTRAGDLSECG